MPAPTVDEIKECAKQAAITDGYRNPVITDVQGVRTPDQVETVTWNVFMTVQMPPSTRNVPAMTTVSRTSGAIYAEPKIKILRV